MTNLLVFGKIEFMRFRKNKNPPALLRALKKAYPSVVCALTHDNPLQLLVATILSAQCTDARVNLVTPALFKRYPTAQDFANAAPAELEKLIHSTGFYRNKSKNILGMARLLMEKHKGEVPKTMDELLELPGVARKTANVVLGTAYNTAVGIVVDTHVTRLSNRLGLTNEIAPVKIEQDLMKIVPQSDWIWFSHALITHGRRVCFARNPNCPGCPVKKECANPVNL
jgi:endonuclease-3